MKKIKGSVLQERIVKVLQELVETPTPTGGEEKLHKFLSLFLQKAGFDIEIQKIPKYSPNLIGKRGKGKLLFCTHIDTYPAFSHPDPYRLKIKGENLIGRGVVDPKGQIASLLVALENTKTPCKVVFTSGEEEEALGSKLFDEKVQEGIVLEPTDLSLCLFQAGAIEIEVNVEGKAVHGSVPYEGKNAIIKAFKIYQEFEKMTFLKRAHPFFPQGGWINLGKIEGGENTMVVPYQCRFQADIGIIPGVSIDEAIRQVEDVVAKAGAKVNFIDISQPIEISPHLRIVKLVKEAFKEITGMEPRIGGMPSWTDAENLFQKGIQCPIFGAGKLSVAHSNYEYISLKELEIFSKVLIRLLCLWGR